MRYKWIRSPSFWLSLSTPVVMIIGFSVTHFELVVENPGGFTVAFLLSLVLAVSVGIWIAERGPRSRHHGADGRGTGQASLSADQAAIYWDLFENATDIVFTTDLSGHFLAGNKAVQRLLGYTVEQAKSLTWEKLVAPYDMWKARQMYKRHAAGEKQVSFELDTVTASGEIKTFEIGSRPMFSDDRLCCFTASHGTLRPGRKWRNNWRPRVSTPSRRTLPNPRFWQT